jgi:2-phospho-L-lactate guanylyltransferase
MRAVLAPDRAQRGTNALLLSPPTAFSPHFGRGSFAQHRQAAATSGVALELFHAPGIALDVDTPEDLTALIAAPGHSAAQSLAHAIGVAQRVREDMTVGRGPRN